MKQILFGLLLMLGVSSCQSKSELSTKADSENLVDTSEINLYSKASLIDLSNNIISYFEQNDFESIFELENDQVKNQLTIYALSEVWSEIKNSYGEFEGVTSVDFKVIGDYGVTYQECSFAEKTLYLKLAFDKDEKIAGMFFLDSKN